MRWLALLLMLVASPAHALIPLGTGCMASVCNNSHCLVNVNAEPFPFVDGSAYGRVVTNTSVVQSAAQVKFGAQSALMDANADNLAIPDDPVWMLPADFSLSVWVYAPMPGADVYVISQSNAAAVAWRLRIQATGVIGWSMWDAVPAIYFTINSPAATFQANTWMLIEITRNGDVGTMWVDGVSVGVDATAAGVAEDETVPVTLGKGLSNALLGYYDAWMITSGGWAWNRAHSPPNRRY
jgi:hypothetical protein